ncbi:MAG: peptidyl-prolyl cis-trans isomerase C [Thalassolituus oleivorans]|jgi:peptidyl-prolyl cis-trans isomerase C
MNLAERLRDEPLIRFGIIGMAIFIVSAWLQPNLPVITDEIVITQAAIDSWRSQYRQVNGIQPNEAQIQATVAHWVDEEVLYRQAFKLGLHQNDSIVRRQLIQKMDFVIEGATPLPPANDEELTAFMKNNAATYRQPRKTSLQQVFLSRTRFAEEQAQRWLKKLQQTPESFNGLGDHFILGQHIANADDTLLRKHFGKQFVDDLHARTIENTWQGPIQSGLGFHLVRITHKTPSRPASLDMARKKLTLDHRLQQEKITRRKALDQLLTLYTLQIANASAREVSNAP